MSTLGSPDQATASQAPESSQRRDFLRLIAGGVAGISTLTSTQVQAALSKSSNAYPVDDFQKIQSYRSMKNDPKQKLMDEQKYWKNKAFQSLELFKKADPKVQKFIEFMGQNAYYTIPQWPVITELVIEWGKEAAQKIEMFEKNPNKFEVVFMPELYARSMPAPITTQDNTMRVAAEFRCLEWMGIMLTHELSHIVDLVVHKENARDPQQYFSGEVKAHLLEMKLLKHWNPAAYEKLITEGTKLYLRNDRAGLFALTEKLYPLSGDKVSPHEASLWKASCLMAIAFEEILRKGGKQEDLIKRYRHILAVETGR